jgi:murein DD-endopeptidase MepM/ murein hydrolase activator NlpD
VYHQVRAGETLSEIGLRYGVPYQDIARLNNLKDADRIDVGQRLRLPSAVRARPPASPPQAKRAAKLKVLSKQAAPERFPEEPEPLSRETDGLFAWPLAGEITSRFGPRNGSFHDGIDIAAAPGTPVLAAADGDVLFSDVLRGYGNVVIVRHRGGYITVYAHNRANDVKEGQVVRRGQRLAEVGQSGRATGPSLHFEVRKDNLARDPLRYLPQDSRAVLKSP